jgi:hypothetical protein
MSSSDKNDTSSTPRQAGSDKVMAKIVEFQRSSPLREACAVTFQGLVQGVPFVGNVVGEWLGELRQQRYQDRFIELLFVLSDAIADLEVQGKKARLDEEFAELSTMVGELAARSNSKEKRERFAWLLAHGATEAHESLSDEAMVMARLLDQLDFPEIVLLRTLIEKGGKRLDHGLWGRTAVAHITEELDFHTQREGEALLRLDGLGLIRAEPYRAPDAYSAERQIEVVELGIRLDEWIQDPRITRGAK